MAKAKSPKFGISFLTNSFQLMCRPKKACSMIKSPPLPRASSSSYMLSPLNSKTFDISFPGTPLPPPSTPSKVNCGFPSSQPRNQGKILYKSSYSSSSDDESVDWRVSAPCRTNKKKDYKNTKYKSKSCIRSSRISSSGDDSTDSLFSSSPPSLDNDSSHHPLKTVYEEEIIKGSSRKQTKPRRFRRYGSKEWSREGEEYWCINDERKPILRKKKLVPMPCMSDDERSFVVVKKSVDPYEDFKKSMSEMIMEKQIYEPRELEHLLMSFLSLNSRLHHKIIIQAFTQILKELFSG